MFWIFFRNHLTRISMLFVSFVRLFVCVFTSHSNIFHSLPVNGFKFCLFVCGFTSHSRIFHSYGDSTVTGEWLQILTYSSTWHSWPMSNDGFLACYTCDMGHPFVIYAYMNGHLQGPVTLSPNAERLPVKLSLPLFTT